MKRRIVLCSGLMCSGKSYWQEKIRMALGLAPKFVIEQDEVRVQNWGRERKLTAQERALSFKLVRVEVEKRFIIDDALTVIVGAVMPTVERHQVPMVLLAQELSARVYGLWFVCNREVLQCRLAVKQRDPKTICDITTMDEVDYWAERFEPPQRYPFLKVDTSDESPEADAVRLQQILEFIGS